MATNASFKIDDISPELGIRAIELAVGESNGTWYREKYVYTPHSTDVDQSIFDAKEYLESVLNEKGVSVAFITLISVNEDFESPFVE